MYRYPNENKWQTVNVLERAGHSKGKYQNWHNVSDKDHAYSLDWSDVAKWKINPDKILNPMPLNKMLIKLMLLT